MMKNSLKRYLKKLVKVTLNKFGFRCFEKVEFYSLDKYLNFNEFRYIMMLYQLYKKIETVPGHIIELGVARGRNAILFGNFIKSYNDDSRRYYGFDTFTGYTDEDLKYNKGLDSNSWKNDSKFVVDRINNAGYQGVCNIVVGDIKKTVPDFIDKLPDLKIALIYIDCNAYLPAIRALEALKGNLLPGSIICIDEKKDGGESRAIQEFATENKLTLLKDHDPFCLPAYIKM